MPRSALPRLGLGLAALAAAVALEILLLSGTTGLAQPLPAQKVLALYAGSQGSSACAVLSPATPVKIKCWGSNSNGALPLPAYYQGDEWGNGAQAERGMGAALPVTQLTTAMKQICYGADFGVGLQADGTVVAWGYNFKGQLAQGDTTSQRIQVPVTVNVGGPAVFVACGSAHACAVLANGAVACWVRLRASPLARPPSLHGT